MDGLRSLDKVNYGLQLFTEEKSLETRMRPTYLEYTLVQVK